MTTRQPTASFWKATRVDATDFWSGRARYDVGATVTAQPLPQSVQPDIRGAGYLHAASLPAETLLDGRWPCRLFEVNGTPASGFDETHPHQGAFCSLTVLRETEAWRALGPNGRDVAALLGRAARLTRDEVSQLDAAQGRQAQRDAWVAAANAARDAGERAARNAAWLAAGRAASHAACRAAWGPEWPMRVFVGEAPPGNAARCAACTLVVRDLIPPDTFDLLYGPWADAIERGAQG